MMVGEPSERRKGGVKSRQICVLINIRYFSIFLPHTGTGKLSIYGPTFADENLTTHKHDKAGVVSSSTCTVDDPLLCIDRRLCS